MNTDAWMKSGKHLPAFMRDFHDQKSLFKCIFERTKPQEIDVIKDVNWVKAHIFTIDCFLWFMARRGYTLQRTRRKGVYRDIEADMAGDDETRAASFAALLPDQAKGNK